MPNLLKRENIVIELLNDFDWRQVFGYAGEENTFAWETNVRPAFNSEVSLESFSREDVAHVVAYSEGENDGPAWLILGTLKDGRHFFIEASCDYTGWDCQAGGEVVVSHDLDHLIRYGLSKGNRSRLDLSLNDD